MLKILTNKFCQNFSKQVDEVRVDEIVRVERLLAPCVETSQWGVSLIHRITPERCY